MNGRTAPWAYFDIFSTADQTKAAQDQIAGINAGTTAATGNINSGINSINTGYTAALQPYLANSSAANAGVNQLGNVLGLNGPAGNASAMTTLQSTPGYQFQLGAGNNAITAADAASGKTSSGNEALALANYNQGLAGTTYNNYVSQLQPFLGAQNNAASGQANVLTGQANAVAGQQDSLANLNYTAQTGIGNANANKDLSGLTASGNIVNALSSLGTSLFTGVGNSGLFSGSGSTVPGAVGPTSLNGAPLQYSDERLKKDIEPVGELYDGTNVYRYRYIDKIDPSGKMRIGVMAQEVERTNPGAVVQIGDYKAVDYGKATNYASDLSKFLEAA